jgi:hypothetical protein
MKPWICYVLTDNNRSQMVPKVMHYIKVLTKYLINLTFQLNQCVNDYFNAANMSVDDIIKTQFGFEVRISLM